MVTNDRTVPYELANENRPSSSPRLRAGGVAKAQSGPKKKEAPGRPAEDPGAGPVTRAGQPIPPGVSNGPAPFTAHFPSPSSFRTTQRLGTQTFSELDPPLPPPFCVCGERSLGGGWKWTEIPREAAAFLPRGSPWVVPHPPSAVSMW